MAVCNSAALHDNSAAMRCLRFERARRRATPPRYVTARPTDRAGDAHRETRRVQMSGRTSTLTSAADFVRTASYELLTQEREVRTTARGTSGAVDGAPPARSSGTSTSTVPAMCTSGVRVVLLQTRKSKTRRCCRTRRAASRRGQGRRRAAQQHGAGRQTDTDWCPITCCGLDVRVRCEGFYF